MHLSLRKKVRYKIYIYQISTLLKKLLVPYFKNLKKKEHVK